MMENVLFLIRFLHATFRKFWIMANNLF